MANKGKNQGFTLIELMIVVGILAILAAVGMTAFGAYVRRSRASEAASILSNFRIKQEAYRATFHQYCPVQGDGWAPSTPANPGPSTAQWVDSTTTRWRQLGAVPASGPGTGVYFRYFGAAGSPGTAGSCEFGNDWLNTNQGSTNCGSDFWYGAVAVQDLDGDGDCEGFAVYTGSSRMQQIAEDDIDCPSS